MSGGGEAVKQGLSVLYDNMTDQEGLFQGGDQGRMFGRFRDAQQPGGGGIGANSSTTRTSSNS